MNSNQKHSGKSRAKGVLKVISESLAVLLFLAAPTSSSLAQTFDDFLVKAHILSGTARQAHIDSFMQAVPAFPVTEDTLVHFIYQGQATSVAVPGDFSGWDPDNAPMQTITGTGFWYRTEIFDRRARLDYKFVLDGGAWIFDPRNPFRAPGGFGDNTELRMPGYEPPAEIAFYPEIPHGVVVDTTFASFHLGNSRQIKVYLPAGYEESDERYPIVLVHDGLEYISLAKTHNVLDYLIAEERLDPLIAVFVPPVDRSAEYASSKQQAFTRFIVEELIPWLDGRYRTRADAAHRATLGSSNGGNISLWLGMNHPEIFSKVGAFSPYVEPDIQAGFANGSKRDLRIYINNGRYDHLTIIHQSVNSLVPILAEKQYDYLFAEHPEGHSYGFWRAYLDDALIFLFGGTVSSIKSGSLTPSQFDLHQNYPNPFNPETTISYELARPINVNLRIFDLLGQEVRTLVRQRQPSGSQSVIWDGRNNGGRLVGSGLYTYSLRAGDDVQLRRMMLIR